MKLITHRETNPPNLIHRLSQMLLLALLIFSLGLMGCEGPQGPIGEEGQQGAQGPVGPAGDDGSEIYSDEGAPDGNIGEIGDYYLNSNTGELYGPKDNDGWGNPIIVLMGEDGQDGENGSIIHSGEGAPSADMGVIGDFYFNKNNGDFYGPKTDSGWGSPTNLMGEDGQDGQDGADGQDGEDGSVIHAGNGAPSADVGATGDFYFDETSGDFYGPKTESGWGSPTNLMGEDGQDGQDGADGQDGEDGSQIHSGTGAPDASLGVVGDFYLDKSSYELYGPKTDSGWGTPLNLKGADGNANVTRYIFSGHDFATSSEVTLDLLEHVDEPYGHAWKVYLVDQYYDSFTFENFNYYYHVPGWGANEDSQYNVSHTVKSYLSTPQTLEFTISLVDGTGENYDNIYIVHIEESDMENLTKQKGKRSIIPDHLDVSDYNEVAEYYGFNNE